MCDSGGKTGKRANRGCGRAEEEEKRKKRRGKREREGGRESEGERKKANYRAFCWYIKL